MNVESTTQRRRFLGRMFGAAVAAGLSVSGTRAAAQDSSSDDWLNYLNTYSAAYKTGPGQVGACIC